MYDPTLNPQLVQRRLVVNAQDLDWRDGAVADQIARQVERRIEALGLQRPNL
jgi:hypothetical protein